MRAIELANVVTDALCRPLGVEELGVVLVAASWLLARWLGVRIEPPPPESSELPDERWERVLAALVLQRALARAAGELQRRLAVAELPVPAALSVPSVDDGPVDPSALREALEALRARAQRTSERLTVPTPSVPLEVVARRFVDAVLERRRAQFAALVERWRPLEVVVGFIVALEGYAAGALSLEVVDDVLWVAVVDDAGTDLLLSRLSARDGGAQTDG